MLLSVRTPPGDRGQPVGEGQDRPDARAQVAFTDDADVGLDGELLVERTFRTAGDRGPGPDSLVAAAATAVELRDDASRSPARWAAATTVPLAGAVLVALLWFLARREAWTRRRRLSRARLRLARVVLELDALEIRFHSAQLALEGASDHDATALDPLEDDLEDVRSRSLRLARDEQRLLRFFREHDADPADPAQTFASGDEATRALAEFDAETRSLRRRAEALADAAEARAGHAASTTALDRLAAPLAQAADEVLTHRDRFPRLAEELAEERDRLLSITPRMGRTASAGEAADLVARHAHLLSEWEDAEHAVADVARRIRRRVRVGGRRVGPKKLRQDAARRVRDRIRAGTAGAEDSLDELRRSLGLATGPQGDPLHALERAAEKIQRRDAARKGPKASASQDSGQSVTMGLALVGVLFGPALVAVPTALLLSSPGPEARSAALTDAGFTAGSGTFWLVALAVWLGTYALITAVVVAVDTARRRLARRSARRRLRRLHEQLDRLMLTLDRSRLDSVAVLGGDSPTGGRAEQAGQRLHEAALAAAWRDVQDLERASRTEQRRSEWRARVEHLDELVAVLARREDDVAGRAEELLAAERAEP